MMLDDRVLDLLVRWEESADDGGSIDVALLAAGDADLAVQLQRHVATLRKLDWLNRTPPSGDELHLPSSHALSGAMLLPNDLPLATLQANLTKADLVDPDKLQALPRAKNAYDLAGLLLESELLTLFQLRAIASGRTRGLRLGRYVILDKIGEGGMGQVFKAQHVRMERVVALKVLPRNAMAKAQGIERFAQEVYVAAQLRHVNIVTAFDADEAEGLHFFVMEHVDGRDLSSIVRSDGPLPVAQAVDCLIQAARGLEYAHGVGLIHRDIKPANLLLDQQGVVKILDMGIARLQTDVDDGGLTQSGSVMGTVDFMAPEQAIDAKTVTPQADLYSLGCTLYFLLTGSPPFGGETLMVKLLGHRQQAPPSLLEARNDVPPELEAIYQKCLAKRLPDRYGSASQLIADLEKIRPQLTEALAPIGLGKSEADADTAPTSLFATQAQMIRSLIPAVTIDAGLHRGKPASAKRGAAFYGGAIGVGLLLCGLLYYGAGMLFKVSTPDGVLVVEVDGDDFVAHLRDHELQLVNEKTQEKTTIQLRRTEQNEPLPPGNYKFALETSSGLKTDVRELTISSGTESKVHVYWEKPSKVANVSPATIEAATESMAAKPVSSSDLPAKPVHDYDVIAKGKWVPLLTSQADFDLLLAEREKPLTSNEQVSLHTGVVTIANTTLYFPKVTAKNFLYRARLKYDSGLNICLRVRQPKVAYAAWWNFGGRHFGIGKSPPGGGWRDFATAHTLQAPLPFFELAIAGIDRKLILYVDGKELFEIEREEAPSDELSVGFSTARNSKGQFKDFELMVLDDDVVKPASRHQQDPDYLAAKHVLSMGGSVQINDGAYLSKESPLQSPPFEITAINISNSEKLTDDDLAIFAECQAVKSLTFHGDPNITGRGLGYFRNCRNLRFLNCNSSGKIGPGLASLSECKQLEQLQLWYVAMTLQDILPLAGRNLKDINFGGTAITDDWMPHFTNIDQLTSLNVRYTDVSDKGLAHFQNCADLKYLSIGRTRVTDTGLAYFKNCRDMEHMIIAETDISDASINVLTGFKNLKRLELQKTKITAARVDELHQALPQCRIHWDGGVIEPVKQ